MTPSPSAMSRNVAFPIPRLAITRPANETFISSDVSTDSSNADIACWLV